MRSEHISVTTLREYLRIKTVQPEPDYERCMCFLKEVASEIGLRFKRLEFIKGYPIALMTLPGNQPSLPSILLNSHTDVVPVIESFWKVPPFEGSKSETGDIIGRGSQDMKCVGIGYLEAIRGLLKKGWKPERSIHVSFVPDEEVGGLNGMALFVKSDEFSLLNVGVALDEGIVNANDRLTIYVDERKACWMKAIASGNTGHGSLFFENKATDKLLKFIELTRNFMENQKIRMKEDHLTIGNVTTINLTLLKAGEQRNIVPGIAEAEFDMRLSPHIAIQDFETMVYEWAKACDISLTYSLKCLPEGTPVEDQLRQYWLEKLSNALAKEGAQFDLDIFTGATDSRYIRNKGIPAFGLTPIRNTPVMLHDHNEFINERNFLEGISFYESILQNLAA